MKIDEEGTKSLGSDHKRIQIKFGASKSERQAPERADRPKLSEARIQTVSKGIENIVSEQPEREWTYEDLIGIFKREQRSTKLNKEESKNEDTNQKAGDNGQAAPR